MKLKYHLPVVGRLYRQRDKARQERNAAIAQAGRRHTTMPYVLTTHMGLTLLLDTTNVLDRNIANLGDFENAQLGYLTAAARRLAAHTPCFIDVGTNWGLYSMAMHKAGVGRVVAFEPDPRNLAHLRANLLLNNMLEAVTIHPLAVWSHAGTLSFAGTAQNEGRDRGWAQVVSKETPAIEGGRKLNTVELPATSLDTAFPALSGQTLIVKIDTEGAEQQVIRGMHNLLAANAVLIQVENHPKNRKAFLKNMPTGLACIHTIEPDLYLANAPMQKLLETTA